MLNPYMDNYTVTEEQDLTDQLIVEAIQMKGLDVQYLERTHNNYNYLFGEDPTSSFKGVKSIEMYPASVSGWEGQGEMMGKFGLSITDSATFILSRSRFSEEFPHLHRPREGDLLFMPVTNAILEIKFVNLDSPFFQQGKQYVYELKVETFEISHETIDAGSTDIQALIDSVLNFDSATETDPYGDNAQLEADVDQKIIFDPLDPFGVQP